MASLDYHPLITLDTCLGLGLWDESKREAYLSCRDRRHIVGNMVKP
jgi:hypothetical protein